MNLNLISRILAAAAISATCAVSAVSAPITIDFATSPTSSSSSGTFRTLTWAIDGVSVAFTGFNLFQTGPLFPAYTDTRTLTTQGFGVYPITVEFLGDVKVTAASFTNIVSGVYSSEVDIIEGVAYNENGAVIAVETTGAYTHSLSAIGIKRIIYQNPAGTTAMNDGMTLANFTFTPQENAVPEPPTVAVVMAALACAASTRRRRPTIASSVFRSA